MPPPVKVTVFPLTVQIVAAELVAKVKLVKPLLAVAVSATGAAPKTTGVAGVKVTVCVAGLMVTLALAEAL